MKPLLVVRQKHDATNRNYLGKQQKREMYMNNQRRTSNMVALAAIIVANIIYAATPTITGVTAQQQYPLNGKIDISYTVTGNIAE